MIFNHPNNPRLQSCFLLSVQLAAISNSTEYKLGLRRNAILDAGECNYTNVE